MLFGALALFAQIVCSGGARAEPELSLAWSAPDACPDLVWARQRVAAQLSREPAADVAQGVHASVTITHGARGFALSVRTAAGGGGGERAIEAASCAELAEAATLIIALSVSEASERGAPASAPRPPAAQPRTSAPEQRTPARDASFALRADVLLDVGFLDSFGYGPSFAAAYQSGVWRAEIAALWIAPQRVEAETAGAGSVRASLWALRAGGCALFGGGRLRGGPCAGGEFGQARGDGGDDLADAKHTRRPWVAGFLGGRASVGLIAKLALVVEADVSFALLRPGFVSASTSAPAAVESVHTPWPAQLRVNAGVELRF